MSDPAKDIEKALEGLKETKTSGSTADEYNRVLEVSKARLDAQSAIGIIRSMDTNADSIGKLAKKVFWLTVIIAIAAAIGALNTLFDLYYIYKLLF